MGDIIVKLLIVVAAILYAVWLERRSERQSGMRWDWGLPRELQIHADYWDREMQVQRYYSQQLAHCNDVATMRQLLAERDAEIERLRLEGEDAENHWTVAVHDRLRDGEMTLFEMLLPELMEWLAFFLIVAVIVVVVAFILGDM
ncbi:hypothetical protein D6833_03675 [Candidatus Parcubacteria bacterium]|nr:MAG: hypothetical protein D6833_03675 [Candidatus Parcubacteria bacterium]